MFLQTVQNPGTENPGISGGGGGGSKSRWTPEPEDIPLEQSRRFLPVISDFAPIRHFKLFFKSGSQNLVRLSKYISLAHLWMPRPLLYLLTYVWKQDPTCPPLVFLPLCTPLSPLLLQAPRCQAWIHHAHHCTRCKVASPQVEAMQARHGPVYLKRLLSRTDES